MLERLSPAQGVSIGSDTRIVGRRVLFAVLVVASTVLEFTAPDATQLRAPLARGQPSRPVA